MKKEIEKLSLELGAKVLLNSAKKEVNSSCFFIGFQPKLPEAVKKLRKF